MIASAYVLRGAVIAIVSVLALSACSRPVAVQAPERSPECDRILSAAPIRLLGELQRETSPRDVAALAWGDPPIVVVCGVDHSVAPDSQVITLDDIDWATEESDAGTVFTTMSIQPSIQVRVPAEYRPEIAAVEEITSVLSVQ